MEKQEFLDQHIKLYSLGVDQIKHYNQIIWQFPTALITLNIVGLKFFLNNPLLLILISICNFSLLLAFYRHILNSKSVIKSVLNIENKLKDTFSELIPKFKKEKIKSTTVIIFNLLTMNVLLIFYALYIFLDSSNKYNI